MVTKNEVFKSRYLKAADLKDGPVVAKISVAELEPLRDFSGNHEEKVVCRFARKLKPLILNRTNWESIADICGSDDTQDWPGTAVEAFATTADLRGKQVDCVRIRKPGAGTKPKPAKKSEPEAKPDYNDDLPEFA